ncbi:winged helix-turn-helix domain-containing protein [Micromonospora sp. R77]|uniref:helix-turn-helix domain-containing protein n=1 Tax=Micromonospora sp. R77 TaxID=2925836 RepID=UPI001F605F5D|nr:helix-turn-helix domain-containing protein [Micromonospora sp. R77]MCI4061473.1 winged helix-turn-helix domain-containing protein [Micromonospora sp. R77]
MGVSNNGVIFLRWPAQRELRSRYNRDGVPRLLVVEGGAQPPVCVDPFEDWVRAPISQYDVEARVRALQNRLNSQRIPTLDAAGTLSFGGQSVTLSNAQATLMELLIERFGEVVYREEFVDALRAQVQKLTRNSLDLHVMRLRRRIQAMGLSVRTVWGRGYLLESSSP